MQWVMISKTDFWEGRGGRALIFGPTCLTLFPADWWKWTLWLFQFHQSPTSLNFCWPDFAWFPTGELEKMNFPRTYLTFSQSTSLLEIRPPTSLSFWWSDFAWFPTGKGNWTQLNLTFSNSTSLLEIRPPTSLAWFPTGRGNWRKLNFPRKYLTLSNSTSLLEIRPPTSLSFCWPDFAWFMRLTPDSRAPAHLGLCRAGSCLSLYTSEEHHEFKKGRKSQVFVAICSSAATKTERTLSIT